MKQILDAILTEQFDDVAALPVPDHYRGVVVRADETEMFEGTAGRDKDPRKPRRTPTAHPTRTG
jgi:crotonyl-CoA reductase